MDTFDVKTGARRGSYPFPANFRALKAAYSADGHRLAAIGYNAFVVWDVATAKPLWAQSTTASYSSGLHVIALSPDGRRVLTGDGLSNVKLWDIERQALVATFEQH